MASTAAGMGTKLFGPPRHRHSLSVAPKVCSRTPLSVVSSASGHKDPDSYDYRMVINTLDSLKRLKAGVVRIWAFNDGMGKDGRGWMSMQPTAGNFDSNVWKGLDWLLVEAKKRQLRLILTLTNYWPEYGGINQYLRWSRGLQDGDPVQAQDFWRLDSDAGLRANQLYRAFVKTLLERRNSISKVLYTDDPTIFAWDICNEPRCENKNGTSPLAKWITETARYVKSLDPNHLVTVGVEGFFGDASADLVHSNPSRGDPGDWVAECSCSDLDFASVHLYPNQWRPNDSPDDQVAWGVAWVQAHIDACTRYLGGKPLCLQEFGMPDGQKRTKLYDRLSALAQQQAAAGGPLVGTLVWMWADPSYPDYDGYTLYPGGAHAVWLAQLCAAINRP